MDHQDRVRGSLVGLAIGDALGHPTEFVGSVRAIRERWGPEGVTRFERSGRHPAGTFTDDTQMAIAVARALVRAGHTDLDTLMSLMGEEFVAWSRSPDNDRAPGGTCLRGCSSLRAGAPWRTAGVRDSKGCGAAMRAAPIGIYFHDDVDAMILNAAASSSLTHRHPTGIASSVAAAAPVAFALKERTLEGMLAFTRHCVEKVTPALLVEVGCEPKLADEIGNREMLAILDRTAECADSEAEDVCSLLGGAWIGEQAVATALWCVLRAKGAFVASVLRGANSSGDSDSIACIAGSIAGALVGFEDLPADWRTDVEKSAMLVELADALVRTRASGDERATEARLDPFGAERAAAAPASARFVEAEAEDESAPSDDPDDYEGDDA